MKFCEARPECATLFCYALCGLVLSQVFSVEFKDLQCSLVPLVSFGDVHLDLSKALLGVNWHNKKCAPYTYCHLLSACQASTCE